MTETRGPKNGEKVRRKKSFAGGYLCSQVERKSLFFPYSNHMYCKQIRKIKLKRKIKKPTSRSDCLDEFQTNN